MDSPTSIWIVLRIRILRTPDPGPFFGTPDPGPFFDGQVTGNWRRNEICVECKSFILLKTSADVRLHKTGPKDYPY